MGLEAGWTTILGCPVGGRDLVLLYDSLTGNARSSPSALLDPVFAPHLRAEVGGLGDAEEVEGLAL
jgi:hypothetical protein